MLDLRYITENTEDLKKVLELRGFKEIGIIDELKSIIQKNVSFKKKRIFLEKNETKPVKKSERLNKPAEILRKFPLPLNSLAKK
ncbi:hypothetical protein LEP1GSC127_0127 [Leptospira kirschneri str. 200801925]|nr:hypothetical protein LEP1GSC127_0127 [Leptospira kirschneri str. 200801925]